MDEQGRGEWTGGGPAHPSALTSDRSFPGLAQLEQVGAWLGHPLPAVCEGTYCLADPWLALSSKAAAFRDAPERTHSSWGSGITRRAPMPRADLWPVSEAPAMPDLLAHPSQSLARFGLECSQFRLEAIKPWALGLPPHPYPQTWARGRGGRDESQPTPNRGGCVGVHSACCPSLTPSAPSQLDHLGCPADACTETQKALPEGR